MRAYRLCSPADYILVHGAGMALRVAVIGAGLAGVSAARRLAAMGHEVTVFDKSRGLGGRMATRRGGGFAIDHGAPGIVAKDPGLAEELAAAGAARTGLGPWVGQPGMSSIVKSMASDLSVIPGAEVASVFDAGDTLDLRFADDRPDAAFDRVVSAIPAPQARRFTGSEPSADAALSRVQMSPVWTLLLAFEDAVVPDWTDPVGPFSAILHNSAKPGRTACPDTWVCHATPSWTARHLEEDREAVCATLFAAFAERVPDPIPDPIYAAGHRWRYARTLHPLGRPYLSAYGGRLLLGGDWALGTEAEDAWRSGCAMAMATGR